MNDFSRLRKSTKKQAVDAGVVRRVAAVTGKDKASVSRTLAGITKRPDAVVVAALWKAIQEAGIECAEASKCA